MNDKEPKLSASKDDLTSLIGSLALNLHMNHPEELSCDLPPEQWGPFLERDTEDYLIYGNTLRFTSIEARNRCVASHEFEKNRMVFAGGTRLWLNAAHDLWRCEIGKPDSAAGRLLALVHETEDIFIIAANAIENESMGVFDALQCIERGGSGNSDSMISGSLASPMPPRGGEPKERGDETHETESWGHL